MAKNDLKVKSLIKNLIVVVVGVALIPVLYNQINSANISNTMVSGIVALIPFFFAVSLVYHSMRGMLE